MSCYHHIMRDGSVHQLERLLPSRHGLFHQAPALGAVIGTFAAIPYVHLQLESWRRFCSQVPLLVHDDASRCSDALASLCREYGAQFERSLSRAPICKGDLSAFVGGLLWAKEREIDLLVKFSRRFVPIMNWTVSLQELALRSQYATYCSWTTSFNFGFRSECVGMAVSEWSSESVMNELIGRILGPEQPFVEGLMHNIARRLALNNCAAAEAYDAAIGERPRDRDGYAVWDFMGTDRRAPSPNYLWHDSATPQQYSELARSWGLPYELSDFMDPNAGHGRHSPIELSR